MSQPLPLKWMHGDVALTAMLHLPVDTPTSAVLMIPGGSDYRIGSHRVYVRLARALADAGHAVMRLDVAGMGDSSGVYAGFESLSTDIASGLAELRQHMSPKVKIFLWGQCDGASAILIGLGSSFEADGAILCNPWVRNAHTTAEQLVRHHYRHRLTSLAAWKRLFMGQASFSASLKSFLAALKTMTQPAPVHSGYVDPMTRTLKSGQWPCLVVIGSDDAGGQEFRLFMDRHQLLGRAVSRTLIADGNHSFSTRHQREALQETALAWLQKQQNS